jgi:hypothetical protein
MKSKEDSFIVAVTVLVFVALAIFGFCLGVAYERQKHENFGLKINREGININLEQKKN